MPTDLDELRKRLTTPPQYTKQPTFTSGDALELIDRCERAEQELKETYAHWSREVGPSSQCKHPSICIDHEGECGWCRAEQDTRRLRDMLELAWGLLANAGGGDWGREGPDWKAAAVRWRDEHYHPSLGAAMKAETEEGADPRGTCPGCGAPALDGKVTCGNVECGSSTGQYT